MSAKPPPRRAADEAERQGLDPDVMGTSVWNALGQFGDKSYLERAEDVVAKVCAAVPEVGVSITRLASQLRDSRTRERLALYLTSQHAGTCQPE